VYMSLSLSLQYCTKSCTKHLDCPTNGFCFGIAPHRYVPVPSPQRVSTMD
jgi:hypothetical protein